MTRVLFLISDTGGGHRAAANAISAALREIEPGCDVRIEDALVKTAAWPTNRSPQIYAWGMKRARWMWGLGFHLLNGPLRARLLGNLGFPGMKRRLRRLIEEHAPDLVVSPHPLLTRIVVRALDGMANLTPTFASLGRGPRPPFAIVVTDLVTGHASWYEPDADLICLPTPQALERAASCGVARAKMVVTGQPLHPRAEAAVAQRVALREKLGWREPVVLMIGGGDGVGDLGARVRAVAAAGPSARIVVVCGKNESLRAELAAEKWPLPVDVRGFVDNLHELMAAADVLVTKGGPGSVIEGCLASLPILIYDYLPGQEIGNVKLVEEAGAGRYVPRNEDLVRAVRGYLEDPGARAAAGARARTLAVPDSADQIARAVLGLLRQRTG
jgi:1,2-diacylglycerol 3-beta-galactosyltransferase